jgi:hypothetical protein
MPSAAPAISWRTACPSRAIAIGAPTAFGDVWSAQEIAFVRQTILWLGCASTGLKVEDIFAGNGLAIAFEGAQTIAKEPTVISIKAGRAADMRPAAIT